MVDVSATFISDYNGPSREYFLRGCLFHFNIRQKDFFLESNSLPVVGCIPFDIHKIQMDILIKELIYKWIGLSHFPPSLVWYFQKFPPVVFTCGCPFESGKWVPTRYLVWLLGTFVDDRKSNQKPFGKVSSCLSSCFLKLLIL